MWDLTKRRWPLAAAAAAALVVAGFAAASNVVVMLGPAGPQPSVASVPWGNALALVNGDSVQHGLNSARPELNNPAIAPGETFTAVVTGRAGPFSYHQTGGKRLDGTIVVVVSGSVSLHAEANPVPFGQRLRLTGKTKAAMAVSVEERLAGEPHWHSVKTVTSGSGGAFAASFPLAVGGRVRASIEGGQVRSARLAVAVAPHVALTASAHRVPAGKQVTLHARVRPAVAASRVYLYVCSSLTGKWHRLTSAKTSAAGAAVLHGRAVPGLFHLRATVRRHGEAAGYAAATSPPVTVTGTGQAPPVRHRPRHHC